LNSIAEIILRDRNYLKEEEKLNLLLKNTLTKENQKLNDCKKSIIGW